MSTTRSPRRLAGLLTALTLALAPVLALGAAAPAEAATGTTTVRICTTRPSTTATPLIASYWWNGSAWSQQSAVRGTCTTFTLGHSGYYYFRASTYALLPCVEYVYGWTSNTVIKQQLPATTSVTVPLQYERSIPLYC
jgi:hypothetical protein